MLRPQFRPRRSGWRFSVSGDLGIGTFLGSKGPPMRWGGWVPAACSLRERWVLPWITEQPLHAEGLSLAETQHNPNYSRIVTCRRLQAVIGDQTNPGWLGCRGCAEHDNFLDDCASRVRHFPTRLSFSFPFRLPSPVSPTAPGSFSR